MKGFHTSFASHLCVKGVSKVFKIKVNFLALSFFTCLVCLLIFGPGAK
jgi:hypothetical protein